MTTKITLTIPYAGKDRTVTGTPFAIARAAELVAQGLPTIKQLNLTQGMADLLDMSDGQTVMGMGNGGGNEFIEGSHTLILALRDAMFALSETGR